MVSEQWRGLTTKRGTQHASQAFVYWALDDGRPMLCPNPVTRISTTRMAEGRHVRVWSCDGHADDATFQPDDCR